MPGARDERRLLESLLWRAPQTRRGLAERLDLGRTRLNALVEALVDEGFVRVHGADAADRPASGRGARAGVAPPPGRRPGTVDLNAEAGFLVGLQMEPDRAHVIVADAALAPLGRRRLPVGMGDSTGVTMAAVVAAIRELTTGQDGRTVPPLGLGIAVCSPVDRHTGLLVRPPGAPRWEGFGFHEHLASVIPGTPVAVDNDAAAMALGLLRRERSRGAGEGAENLVALRVGPRGFGAGLVMEGRLQRGADGGAGEIGHMTALPGQGPACRCGRRGCLEAIASPAALLATVRAALEGGGAPILAARLGERREIDLGDLAGAAREGDPDVHAALDDAGLRIGWALAVLANVLNPERIVAGGAALGELGPLLLAGMRRGVQETALPIASRRVGLELLAPEADPTIDGVLVLAAAAWTGTPAVLPRAARTGAVVPNGTV